MRVNESWVNEVQYVVDVFEQSQTRAQARYLAAVANQWCYMAIDALHFHSREHLSSTDHVFALIGRFLLTKDARIERISSLGSTLEVQPVSGLVLGLTSWRLNWLGQGIFFKENPLARLLVLCESDGHKVKHEL